MNGRGTLMHKIMRPTELALKMPNTFLFEAGTTWAHRQERCAGSQTYPCLVCGKSSASVCVGHVMSRMYACMSCRVMSGNVNVNVNVNVTLSKCDVM